LRQRTPEGHNSRTFGEESPCCKESTLNLLEFHDYSVEIL
jgi:hypothetical protein